MTAQDTGGAGYRSVWRELMTTPFTQGYVDADGLRTRYVHAGTPGRPAVLLLHGTGGHWETFAATIPALADAYDCWAPDMLGCGFTDKPDKPYEIADYVRHALAFLDAVGVERCTVVGVSLGSWVACRLALTAPDRVEALVLNSPAGLLELKASVAGDAIKARAASAADPSWDKIRRVLEHLFYDPATMPDDIVAIRQAVYSLPGMDRLMARSMTLFDNEIRRRNLLTEQEWRSIDVPALVVEHVDSPDDYLETAERIVELMPHAEPLVVHEASHWPHFERPDVVNPALRTFLDRVTGAAR